MNLNIFRLYRIQLDTAQREIYRAQDVIGIVDKQRLTAEKDAAKSRTKARELNERLLMESARNEAYQLGLQEGLNQGRELAFGGRQSAVAMGGGEIENGFLAGGHYISGGSQSLSSQNDDLTRPRSIVSEYTRSPSIQPDASPGSAFNPLPSVPPTRHTKDSGVRRTGSFAPMSGSFDPPPGPLSAPPSLYPTEDIRPASVRNVSHTPRMNSAIIPPDNFIPSLDADNRIRIPPPFEFQRIATPERQPSPQLPALSDVNQEPIPIPPRSNSAPQRKGHYRTRNSSSDSNSSSLSQLEIINNSDYLAGLRTPMTMIPEVNSAYSGSPHPYSEDGERASHVAYHQQSLVSFNDT